MALTIKTRPLYAGVSSWKSVVYFPYPAISSTTTGTGKLIGLQRTQSYGHKWPPRKTKKGRIKGQPPPDLGGDFLTQKVTIQDSGVQVSTQPRKTDGNPATPGSIAYSGDWKIYPNYSNFVAASKDFLSPSTDAELDAIGTKLVSMALPTNPLSGMGQFLGELKKDGIPRLPSLSELRRNLDTLRNFSRYGSNQYLNAQFGWAPLVRDLLDFVSVLQNITKHIKQYAGASGKPQRRVRKLPIVSSTSIAVASSYGSPALPLYDYKTAGKLYTTTTTSVEHWFSGSFTYCLPIGKDALSQLAKYEAYGNKLFGLRLNPDLLYKLSPWTWLVDWVTTLGPIVRNWSAFQTDGLVMTYGYVMERKIQTIEYALSGVVLSDGRTVSCSQVLEKVTLSRRRATPYGFGLDPRLFTPFQWSIIAALGISKAPRSLTF